MSGGPTYAVSWREDDRAQHVGKLELRGVVFRLQGRGPGCSEVGRTVVYTEVDRVASARPDNYRATLVVLCDGMRITITSLDGPGAAVELEHELRTRAEKPHAESVAAPMISGG